MMTSKQQDMFFALIRRALWQDKYDVAQQQKDAKLLESISPTEDWKAILSACDEHRILCLMVDSFKTLPVALQPSENQFCAIDRFIFKVWKQRIAMHKAIVDVFDAIEKAGGTPVLLKGEGLAALYPENTSRIVGDIDVLVGEEHFEEACIAIDKMNGVAPDVSAYYNDSEHHYETTCGDTPVEIHRCIADDGVERFGADMNKWATREMESHPCRTTTISGKEIALPPVSFDMFYIFQHLAKHVLRDGGGLRQLIDWALYLHFVSENNLEYDKDELFNTLKKFDHLRPWQILSGILHYQLGLSTEMIPFYNEEMALKSQGACLNDMVFEGNFGWSGMDDGSNKSANVVKRAFTVMHNKYADYRKRQLLFPKSALLKLYQGIMISIRLHFPFFTRK